jgi:REP element-mobilizing transposase RayT
MAGSELLACRSLCYYAGSHPFILRTKYVSASSLKNRIAHWRNHVTRAWPHRTQLPIWQRDFWDRQLRRSESYTEKWHYVVNNPVRHGYVRRAADWPYQGELNVLAWHDR